MPVIEEETTAGPAAPAGDVLPVDEVPVFPLREGVLFPSAMLPLTIGRPNYVELAIRVGEGATIGVVAQREFRDEQPGPDALNPIGSVAIIHKIIRVAEDRLIMFCQGVRRMRTLEYTQTEPFLKARVEALKEIAAAPGSEFDALVQNVIQLYQHVIANTPDLSDELQLMAANIPESGALADFVAATMPGISHAERQQLLEQLDVRARIDLLNKLLEREVDRIKLRQKIHSEAQGQLSQTQREIYLREQLRAIQKELGELDETQKDVEMLRAKVNEAGMPEAVKAEVDKELERLSHLSTISPEYGMVHAYLDWMVSLPWSVSSAHAVDIVTATRILDEDHYGLDKVKDRILDYLAVLQLRPSLKGPILCFTGAPGVGKTSLGRSIARALGRKFTRLSLGGMHDEAEIRGHRRTYIGALPGQIIQGIRRAGANDPVFMLDEVDKLGRDFHGDPASALLEVLDPEQNSSFRDNYLDVPFDLSKVLFITTANQVDPVPDALRDRMEVIELQGYGEDEKRIIAVRYLIPRQVRENGLEECGISFTDEAILHIINHYTREAGVRHLERNIGNVCRKQARRRAAGDVAGIEVTPAVVEQLLGAPKFRTESEVAERTRRPGVAVGLAWTPVGGDVLFVEAGRLPGGSKGLIMTGQLGSVMQESVQAALTWVRTSCQRYGIDPESFKTADLHVHVPSGAVPKDGPSAGITIATALLSTLTGRPIRPHLAMTGEITLTGLVLPVGAIKEKVLAARRSAIRDVILPLENQINVKEDLKAGQLTGIRIHYVRAMEEVIDLALTPEPAAEKR